METHSLQLIAGTISSLLFASSHIPMLRRVFQTRDLKSYSPVNLLMANIGNLINWLYITSLPSGPIWYLHAYFTVTTAVMLGCYIWFEWWPQQQNRAGMFIEKDQSQEMLISS